MSLRERILIALGAIAVAGTVIVPVAYRLETEVLHAGAVPADAPGPTPPLSATPGAATPMPTVPTHSSTQAPHIVVDWVADATAHRDRIGVAFSYDCPPNGPLGLIWGTGVYTDDSLVCTAAVHDGRISLETGGTVTIVMRPGRDSYLGTTANGVHSDSYLAWPGSYEFVLADDSP